MKFIKRIRDAVAAIVIAAAIFSVQPVAAATNVGLPDELIPVGEAVGISIETDGIMIVTVSQISTSSGNICPAKESGILPGDIVTKVNGVNVDSTENFKSEVAKAQGKEITLTIMRDGSEKELTVNPVKNTEGEYELGLWLRDSVAGIGTVTFYDPETGAFGALGHSVNDVDTGIIIPLGDGCISEADIISVIKGQVGDPGELQGAFDMNSSIGDIEINSIAGIFGTITIPDLCENSAIPVASSQEINTGKATIISDVSGKTKEYDIVISRIYSGDGYDSRNMMITVVDDELLALTGGIVQGMSGSPVIQNGKLVGAVTHVLVNDPTRGYGIFIENMLKAAA